MLNTTEKTIIRATFKTYNKNDERRMKETEKKKNIKLTVIKLYSKKSLIE